MGERSVVFTNACLRNGGDAAIVEAMEAMLGRTGFQPDDIVVEDIDPKSSTRLWPEREIRPYLYRSATCRWRFSSLLVRVTRGLQLLAVLALPRGLATKLSSRVAWLRHRHEATAIISVGGTYFIQAYATLAKVVNLLHAQKIGKPTILFTQTIEIPTARIERAMLGRAIRSCDLALARDQPSADRMVALGADARRVKLCADPVFGLRVPGSHAVQRNTDRPTVSVSIRDVSTFIRSESGEDQLRENLARLCEHLVLRRGVRIRFVSTCQGVPGYRFDDSLVARNVLGRMVTSARSLCEIDDAYHAPEELRSILSTSDLVVSMRMHGSIQSLIQGVPVVPIAYEEKIQNLWTEMELSTGVISLDDTDSTMIQIVDDALDSLGALRIETEQACDRAYASVWSCIDDIRDVLTAPLQDRAEAGDP